MQLPEYVYEVLQKLNNNGYEAYCVGGCVRDYLLGQCPEDYDVTTSALPEQIIEVFDGYRLQGRIKARNRNGDNRQASGRNHNLQN